MTMMKHSTIEMKKNKLVILDNGHGEETAGKRSPDGLFREYRWCRDFANRLGESLEKSGYDILMLVPENKDISLTERVKRANAAIKDYGAVNCILISIHNNAACNGSQWCNATGWEAYTTHKYTNSDKLADLLYEEIEMQGIKIRKDTSDGDLDKEANFKILTVNCPVVLTENMFMDSKDDVEFLESEEGIRKLLTAHLYGIRRYFEDRNGTHQSWVNINTPRPFDINYESLINKCILK